MTYFARDGVTMMTSRNSVFVMPTLKAAQNPCTMFPASSPAICIPSILSVEVCHTTLTLVATVRPRMEKVFDTKLTSPGNFSPASFKVLPTVPSSIGVFFLNPFQSKR